MSFRPIEAVRALCIFSLLTLSACPGPDGSSPSGDTPPADSDGGATPGAAGGIANDPAAASVAPLAPTELVYAKAVRSGVEHLYAYDIAARTERLLSKLDDDGTSGTHVNSVALSPDRKWIAFSGFFRVDKSETQGLTGMPTPPVWVMSVDGSTFRRVLGLQDPHNSVKCTIDAECTPYGEVCDLTNILTGSTHYCAKKAFDQEIQVRSFLPDESAVVVAYTTTWIELNGTIAGGTTPGTLTLAGALDLFTNAVTCPIVSPGTVHPKRGLVGMQMGALGGCKEGMYTYPLPLTGTGGKLVVAPGDPIVSITPSWGGAWLPDGSMFLFSSLVKTVSGSGEALLAANPDTGQTYLVHPFPDGYVENLAVAPDGASAVVEFTPSNGGYDAWHHDLELYTFATQKLEPLVTGHVASHVSF